jgi:single-strand DNA-binding protein
MANKTYINSVTVQGFIGADAHPKELDGGKIVLNFSVATSRFRGEGEAREQFTEWHRITVWDKLAGSTGHLAKGAHVNVIGELRSREYNTAGGKVQTYDIVASKISSVAREEAVPAPQQPEPEPATPPAPTPEPPPPTKATRKRKEAAS